VCIGQLLERKLVLHLEGTGEDCEYTFKFFKVENQVVYNLIGLETRVKVDLHYGNDIEMVCPLFIVMV